MKKITYKDYSGETFTGWKTGEGYKNGELVYDIVCRDGTRKWCYASQVVGIVGRILSLFK